MRSEMLLADIFLITINLFLFRQMIIKNTEISSFVEEFPCHCPGAMSSQWLLGQLYLRLWQWVYLILLERSSCPRRQLLVNRVQDMSRRKLVELTPRTMRTERVPSLYQTSTTYASEMKLLLINFECQWIRFFD